MWFQEGDIGLRVDVAGMSKIPATSESDGLRYGHIADPVRNFLGALLLPLFLVSLTQSLAPQAAAQKEATMHKIGVATIRAIADGDPAYIASIVDPEGIYVGYDNVRHTTGSFKNDLAHHVGLYCELFEKDCKTDHNPAYTLEHTLGSGAGRTNSNLKFKIEGNVGTLEYWEFGGAGDLIATFSFRFADGKWYLYNIHYV